MGPQTRAWPPQRILPKAVLLGSSAETKFSSFELFAARIVSGEYPLGGTIMIQVRPPICPYCRQPMKLFRTVSTALLRCLSSTAHLAITPRQSSSSHPFATFPQKSQKKRAALDPAHR